MKSSELIIAGYVCGDYFYDGDVDDFKSRFGNESFIPNGVSYGDSKVSIREGSTSDFFNFLYQRANGKIKSIQSGGGGENSRKAFMRERVESCYIDTSTQPQFNTGFNYSNGSYFAGISPHAVSLIIPSQNNGNGAGTFTLKAGRGDVGKYLGRAVVKNVESLLRNGDDVLVNSISNSHLADVIASNVRGDLYSVITTYLGKTGEELNRLMRSSRVNFFSAKEFYWINDKDKKFNDLFKGDFSLDKAVKIHQDMKEFADERKLVGSLVVTIGENGAIHYNRNNGRYSKWVRLKIDERENIQEHLKKNNQSTNSAGDNFTARFIHALREEEATIEEAIIEGSEFAIKEVLNYNLKGGNNFLVDKLK